MVERYYPREKARSKPKPMVTYAILPRKILGRPPLRSRGQPPAAGFSIFEFSLAVGCVTAARLARRGEAHRVALRAGKRAMDAQRAAEQPIHDKYTESPYEQFQYTGRGGYIAGFQKFYSEHTDADTIIEASRYGLLRAAGLATNASNLARVPGALDRLTRAIGNFSPALDSWHTSGLRLTFTVRREWLPAKNYCYMVWPMPTSGVIAARLHLFLATVDLRRKLNIDTGNLARRIGIRPGRSSHMERSLDNAMAIVNANLRKLVVTRSWAIINAGPRNQDVTGEWEDKLRLGEGYKIVRVGDGTHVSFQRLPNQTNEQEHQPQDAQVPWDDKKALAKVIAAEEAAERDRFRENCDPEDYLSDDEIDELRERAEYRRRRDREDAERAATKKLFGDMNERLRKAR